MVYNDTPSSYYFQATSLSWRVLSTGYRMQPNYLYTNEQTNRFDEQLKKGLVTFESRYIKVGMTEYEKEKAMYPVCDSVEQNYYYKNNLFVKSLAELTTYIVNCLYADQQHIVVKFANIMLVKELVEEAVCAWFIKAQKSVWYMYAISEITHNIYIKIVQ